LTPVVSFTTSNSSQLISFMVKVPILVIGTCSLITNCSHHFCDGRHEDSTLCPSVGSKDPVECRGLLVEVELTGCEGFV
jgi:hypothetical protein